MIEIKVTEEILPTIAGQVTFYTNPCPFGEKPMSEEVAKVGSTQCKLCRHYGILQEKHIDQENTVKSVLCNHV